MSFKTYGGLFLALGYISNTWSAGTDHVIQAPELMRIVAGLLGVLGMIVVLAWLTKRLNRGFLPKTGGFQIIGAMALGSREKIILMRVGERYLLLGVAGSAVSQLYDFGLQLPPGFEPHSSSAFSQILQSMRNF